MDDVLLGIVLERLGKSPLADEATDLLLAAFESEESLSAQLSGEAAERPSADPARVVPPQPAGAYASRRWPPWRSPGIPAGATMCCRG